MDILKLIVKMKMLLRIAFFSLVLGIALSFNTTVQAQETVKSTEDEIMYVTPTVKVPKTFSNLNWAPSQHALNK